LEASRPLAGEDPAIAEILDFIGKGQSPRSLPPHAQ
jgi:UDP-N-acetylglucosamine acyltransferase